MNTIISTGAIALHRTTTLHQASFGIVQTNLAVLEQYLHQLHPRERSYYDGLKADARRLSYLLGRLTAKAALQHYTGEPAATIAACCIEFGIFQYPVVKELRCSGIQVSITHTDHIGIAFAYPEEHPLSVDIERTDPANAAALQSLITEHDRQQLVQLGMDNISGHTLIWTAKESLSKVVRTGLTMDPRIMEVNKIERMEHQLVTTYQHWLQYKTISWPVNEHCCSITLPRHTTPQLALFEQLCNEVCGR